MKRHLWFALLGFALPGILAPSARAQVSLARMDGIVSDPQLLPLPGVKVVLTETRTALVRTTETSARGTYEFPSLNPGQYQLKAQVRGFAPEVREVTLEVNQALRLDLILKVGQVKEQVEVVGSAQMLRTTDASLGEVIEPTMTQELPLNGRHLLDLAQLAPSTHSGFGAQTGTTNPLYWRPQQDSALSVGGGRPNANNFLYDGSTDTDPTFNTLAFSPSPDAVQEFKVQTGSYSAEFGGAGGAQINIVTKSGSNQFHGDIYEFLRNSALDARSLNDPSQIPHLSQNQFGASLGGPIKSNRNFFFANYEGFRLSNVVSQVETVPTMEERMGDFSKSGATIYNPASAHANPNFDPSKPVSPSNSKIIRDPFTNNVIPTASLNPVALQVLNILPLPNLAPGGKLGLGTGAGSGLDSNNYLDLRTSRNSNDQGTVRMDHNFSNGDSLFARYSIGHETDFTPQNLPGFGAFDDNQAQNLTLSLTHIFNPTTVNDFWFGLSRLSMHRFSENNFTHDYISQLGIQGVGFGGKGAWGMPWFAVQGYDGMGDSFAATPVQDWDTVLQFGDIWNRQMGRHSVKVGGDFRHFYWPMWGFFQNRGFYQFTNGFTSKTATNDGTGVALASFLLGLPVVKQRQAGIPVMDLRQSYADAFLQDDWRVTNNTTLNLGVRYEFATPLYDVSNPNSNLTFKNGQPFAFIGGQLGMPRGLVYANPLDFAPRLGLAHTIPGRYGFVLRASYGIFYTPIDMNTFCNQRHVPPLVFAETDQSDNFTPAFNGFNFAPAVLGKTTISFAAADAHPAPEYVNQWSFSLQKALPGNFVVETGYQGSRGIHLQRAHLINNAPPGPGPLGPRRPFPKISFLPGTVFPSDFAMTSTTFPVSTINLLENSAQSWYDAGWVDLRRRFSHGLTLLANYTYSKSLTNAPDFRSAMDESAIPQNNSDLAAEKGLACDVRHRMAASLVYNIPGLRPNKFVERMSSNWSVASVLQAQSGLPFTISVFGDTANSGTVLGENPIRANVTGQPLFPAGTHSSAEWFNPAAFVAPPAYQFGNAGRNTVEGPGMQLLDFALTREFRLTERAKFQFRTEFFNALNHTNFGTPNRFVNTPQFGTITTAMHPGREIQFGARITF
ncbi:MAG TPA: carboxypeptidase regulatory-like domain-containing protein [Terriglobia bacterium]|nr:carboxypeptidase regulatory-like domain-containing protein [Terriglobia bacterium]